MRSWKREMLTRICDLELTILSLEDEISLLKKPKVKKVTKSTKKKVNKKCSK